MGEVLVAEVLVGEVSVGLQTVCGQLKTIRVPHDIIVVAEGWPSCLISILALKLPLFSAYFPKGHHQPFSYLLIQDLKVSIHLVHLGKGTITTKFLGR